MSSNITVEHPQDPETGTAAQRMSHSYPISTVHHPGKSKFEESGKKYFRARVSPICL